MVNGVNTDQPTGTGVPVTSTTLIIPANTDASGNVTILNAIQNNTNNFGSINFPFAITSQNNRIVVDVRQAL